MPRGRQLAGTLPVLTSHACTQKPPFLCSSVHVSKQKSLESRSDGFANSGGDQSSDTVRGGVGRRGLCSPSCVATGKSLGFRSLSMTQLIELRRVWLRFGVFPRWQEVQRFQTVLLSLFRRKIQYFWNLIAKWKFPSFLLLRPQEVRSKLIELCKQSAFILGKYFHHRSIHP